MRALIFGLLLALLLASPCLADTVKVTKITADISFSKDYGAISTGSTKTIILHLPVTLEELNNTNNNITITADSATASTTIDLYVNGVAVATNYAITGGASHTWSFTDFATAGVNMNTNLLNITIVAVANATSSDVLNLYGVNLPLTANYTVKVTETELSKPYVDYERSHYSVKDEITVTQDSSLNLTNVVATLEYPNFAITKPVLTYNFGTLNTSQTKSLSVSYEKYGPFVPLVRTIKGEGNYTVEMQVYSYENLTATFDLDPTSQPWNQYFPQFSYDMLRQITLNGENVSWEHGSILMTLNLHKGYNILNITYATPTPMFFVMAKPTPWYQRTIILPVWMWIVLAIALVAIVAYRRK